MSSRPNFRGKKSYKEGVDAHDATKKREDTFNEILTESERKLDILPTMVAGVSSNDNVAQLQATTQLRKLLSIEQNTPIDEVIAVGLVPRFVQFLDLNEEPQVQFEAAWALTEIASGTLEHTRVVIKHRAVPKFVQLLSSPSEDVREQAVLALGTVAIASPRCRDHVLYQGALGPLLAQLNGHAKLSMLRKATWTLSNLCSGNPEPWFEETRPALPVLKDIIHLNDHEVLSNVCWTLYYLSGTTEKIEEVIEAGVCSRLVQFLAHPSQAVFIPALRTVGNIVRGVENEVQHMIDNGVLCHLLDLVSQNFNESIKKATCRIISNITAGNRDQIQAVINTNIIPHLVQLLDIKKVNSANFDIQKEAARALSNATSRGTSAQIKYLVSQGCIKPLCDLLVCPDPRIVTICLNGLENILKVGESEDEDLQNAAGVNLYAQYIDEAEGLEKIENLLSLGNKEIYEKAMEILETYWVEDDEEDQNVAPE